ncbi:MAG: hypothetical protein GTN83_08440 [Acidobacteria bacterium]|nr:hypothetical protein [Acidobacteriota bacterium]
MIRRVAVVSLLAAAFACSSEVELAQRAVLKIDDATLTRGELDAYLALNLARIATPDDAADETAEPPRMESRDSGEAVLAHRVEQANRVRSRLLDTWIDEHLVLSEAAVRGLTIDDELLDEHLDDPAYEAGEGDRDSQRNYLRSRLLIQLVQSQVLQEVRLPTEEETLGWLEDNPDSSIAGRQVRLRSLRFDEADEAQRVHRDLRRNRITFNEAVVQNSDDESQGIPTVVEWATLPPQVQQALEKLRRGWSSVPVDLGGNVYLFQVVQWIDPEPEAQIEAAREEMISRARRAAWKTFVADLRAAADIRILQENLGFTYVLTGSD